MPEIPFVQGGVIRTAGIVGGTSSLATTITANASANTKGSVVELIAATEFDANWILVNITNASTGVLSYLIDILISAATEQVIVPDLTFTSRNQGASSGPFLFPLYVPKGSRLAARCQAGSGSATCAVSVTLIAGTLLGGGQAPAWVSAYGATASSLGTAIDAGGTANTDSAWVEIASATDRAHNWLVIAGRFGDGTTAAVTNWRLSVGIGAATEQVLIPDLEFSTGTNEDLPYNPVICLPCFVPAGSRLTARARCSVTTVGDRSINLKIYGAG